MAIPNKTHRVTSGQIIPLALIGLGLIVIGLVVMSVLTGQNTNNTQFTVVPAKVNYPAPELSLINLNSQIVSLSDYRKDIVLINNWSTWCPPCKEEMPVLLSYYKEHAEQGFMLIGIEAGDPVDQVKKFVSEYGLNFPILLDPDTKALIAFENESLPSSYVIDRNGNVVLAWTGPISQAMLEKYVTPLLEQ